MTSLILNDKSYTRSSGTFASLIFIKLSIGQVGIRSLFISLAYFKAKGSFYLYQIKQYNLQTITVEQEQKWLKWTTLAL